MQNPILAALLCCLWVCGWRTTTAQQAPFYVASNFATNVSFRTNVCDRQRLVYHGKLALPNALQGLNLSVALTNYKDEGAESYFSLNVDGVIDKELPGLVPIIMDELAARAGFSWRNSYGVVQMLDPEVDGNRTYSDLLEWETKVYDIAADVWYRTLERMNQEVSFPEGWYDASYILVQVNHGKIQLNIWSFLLPFQWQVWILTLVTVLTTGLVYIWVNRLSTTSKKSDDLAVEKEHEAAVFYSFMAMTGHLEYHPTTLAARILNFSLAFFALLVSAAYTANLVSFLAIRTAPASQISSLQEAVFKRVPICVQGMIATDEYLSKKYPKAILKRKSTEQDVFLALQQGEECQIAVVPQAAYDLFRHSKAVNRDCTLEWYGRVEQIVPAGLATAVDSGILCSSLVSHVLDYHLLEMKTDGFLDRTWNDHLDQVGDNYCVDSYASNTGNGARNSTNNEARYSLSMQEMAGVFIVHAGLSMLALFLALVSWSFKKRCSVTSVKVGKENDVFDCMESQRNKKEQAMAASIGNSRNTFSKSS